MVAVTQIEWSRDGSHFTTPEECEISGANLVIRGNSLEAIKVVGIGWPGEHPTNLVRSTGPPVLPGQVRRDQGQLVRISRTPTDIRRNPMIKKLR